MSQLSFASFFDLAKEAAPLTNAKPVLPTVNAPTIPRRMMTTDEARRQFISVFMDTARSQHRWNVFRDFIALAASELDIAQIGKQENFTRAREICSRYSESDIRNMHELFWLMVCALEAKFHDFLGAVFMELELGNDRNGQYFTPYHVQSLLAKLVIPDIRETVKREGFVTVSDPAAGAGGMIIAYADNLLDAGFNPSENMFASCIDIDPVAADMAFVQLSLLGIAAEVVTGDSLTMKYSAVRYTPVWYINGFEQKLAFQARYKAMREILNTLNIAA